MARIQKRIEVVRSSVPGFSSLSQSSANNIVAVLAKHYTDVRLTLIDSPFDLHNLIDRRPDLVFLGMKYISGEIVGKLLWLSSELDKHGIAYTGSDQNAHYLERDKSRAKIAILAAGLATSPFYLVKNGQLPIDSHSSLNFPLFVKPSNGGGGVGVDSTSVVHDHFQLAAKIRSISSEYEMDSMVEEYLPGREFSVAILDDEFLGLTAMPIELIAKPDSNGDRMLSQSVKCSNSEETVAVTDQSIRSFVAQLALDVFRTLGARDYGRIDIRLDANGTPNFLEANLIPSLISGYGSFPKACLLNSGLGYKDMIMRITELGLARHTNDIINYPEPALIPGGAFPVAEVAL